jgi:hypothetical protein
MSSFQTRTAAYFKRSNERGDQEGQGHKLSDGGIHFESESENWPAAKGNAGMKERNKNSNLELIGENEWGEEAGCRSKNENFILRHLNFREALPRGRSAVSSEENRNLRAFGGSWGT